MDQRERPDPQPRNHFYLRKREQGGGPMKVRETKMCAGFTLAEMLVSVGCGTLILAAIIATGVSLQKSYSALDGYSTAEGDQLRVLDYIAMDCRRAISATVSSVTVNGITENALVLTLPP